MSPLNFFLHLPIIINWCLHRGRRHCFAAEEQQSRHWPIARLARLRAPEYPSRHLLILPMADSFPADGNGCEQNQEYPNHFIFALNQLWVTANCNLIAYVFNGCHR